MDIEVAERRKRTVAILNERGVPHRDDLPVLATSTYAKLRSAEEVILRSLCLWAVMAKGFDYPVDRYEDFLTDAELKSAYSPAEQAFLADPAPDQSTADNFTWRGEACWTLLWSIGLIDELQPPSEQFDAAVFEDIFIEGWRTNAKMRPESEIYNEHDLI